VSRRFTSVEVLMHAMTDGERHSSIHIRLHLLEVPIAVNVETRIYMYLPHCSYRIEFRSSVRSRMLTRRGELNTAREA